MYVESWFVGNEYLIKLLDNKINKLVKFFINIGPIISC